MPARRSYPSDITQARWQYIEPILKENEKASSRRGRKQSTSLREVVNAINYRWSTGCTWRMLPHDFPAWETVYTYFDRWRRNGQLMEIREVLLRKHPHQLTESEQQRRYDRCHPHHNSRPCTKERSTYREHPFRKPA